MTQGDLRALLVEGRRLRASRANAPDIWCCVWRERQVLVKTYQHCSVPYRQSVGRLAMNREWWALQRLDGTGCAPRPVARPAPWTVVMEMVEGTPFEALSADLVDPARLLAEAQRLLEQLAQARLAHSDMGHDCWSAQGRESNLMWTDQGRLVAIDFAGCWRLDGALGRVGRALQLHDRFLLTKVLYHYGDSSLVDHPAWREPSRRALAWWDLMKLLGKV